MQGAHDGAIRYLKSIMGLWIIQSIKKETNDKYSSSEEVVRITTLTA